MNLKIGFLLVSFISSLLLFNSRAYGQDPWDNARRENMTISLEWRPYEPVDELAMIDLSVFQNKKISVKKFNDLRQNKTEIGRSIEMKPEEKIRFVYTKDDVATWLTARFVDTLKDFEIPVVDHDATLYLEADILKFYVTEKTSYKADLALRVRIRSQSGALLWERLIFGYSKLKGVRYLERSYSGGLSTACVSAVYQLLQNESLKSALQ